MKSLTLATLALLASPAMAQQTSATVDTGAQGVAAANLAAHADVQARQATVDAVNAQSQADYAQDMAAYRAALVANHRAAIGDAHRERAYAAAMVAWREQVSACRKGHPAACNAPTPNPADFW